MNRLIGRMNRLIGGLIGYHIIDGCLMNRLMWTRPADACVLAVRSERH